MLVVLEKLIYPQKWFDSAPKSIQSEKWEKSQKWPGITPTPDICLAMLQSLRSVRSGWYPESRPAQNQCGHVRLVVTMLTLSVFMLLVWCLEPSLPETECSFSATTGSLECSVHLYSVYSVQIVCSHDQANQPVIEQNQFGQSHNLSKLEIERCPQLQIRRGAFQGLHNLHTIKVL